MATPIHGLTRTSRGWIKRVDRKPKWICSITIAPTPEAADEYFSQHFHGRKTPRPRAVGDAELIPLADLCDLYLARKRQQRDQGSIQAKTYAEYADALQTLCDAVGSGVAAGELTPFDFAKLDSALAKRFGPNRRKKYILTVRSLFKWSAKPPLRLPVPDYGDALTIPTRAEFRRDRKAKREKYGLLLFTPEEIREQLAGKVLVRKDGKRQRAKPSRAMRAMILLAVNCGFGNTDLAGMPLSILDLDTGWIDYARQKTGAERRAWLWPETVAAVRDYLRHRPEPASKRWGHLLFLTRAGQPYLRDVLDKMGEWKDKRDKIGERYRVLLGKLGQRQFGRNFYTLRRTYRTLAAETGEERAIDLSMGHADRPDDMGGIYTQGILDSKLFKIAEHVRSRVLNPSLESQA